ncbi:MAG: thioredoxin domain-containing protein [Acidiferrobacterales bacterium]
MPSFLTDAVKKEVRTHLAGMNRPVRIAFFTQKNACGACRNQELLLDELASLSSRLTVEVRDLVADAPETK